VFAVVPGSKRGGPSPVRVIGIIIRVLLISEGVEITKVACRVGGADVHSCGEKRRLGRVGAEGQRAVAGARKQSKKQSE